MNDIQAKENIYNAATAAVNKQQENLSAAAAQVNQCEEKPNAEKMRKVRKNNSRKISRGKKQEQYIGG